MPKRGVDMHDNEITRAFKTVNDTYIEPISFIVPRRAESFQDDIYPPTIGVTPAMNASEWFSGKEAIPPKISMGSLYDGQGLKEVTGIQDKPTSSLSTESKPEPKPEPKPASPVKKAPEPVSEPTPVAKPAPSMKDQGASMAAMVNKFADDEEPEKVVESSFDEPSKPVERSTRSPGTSSPSVKASPFIQKEDPIKAQSPTTVSYSYHTLDSRLVAFANYLFQASPTTAERSPAPSSPSTQPTAPSSTTGSVSTDTVQREISAIKDLIAEQTKTIASQAQQVSKLTSEIESLKAQLG